MLLLAGEELMGYAAHKRVVGVTVREKGTDGQQDLRYGQRRTPVVLKNVEADCAVAVYVAVVDSCAKTHLRWFKGVFP